MEAFASTIYIEDLKHNIIDREAKEKLLQALAEHRKIHDNDNV